MPIKKLKMDAKVAQGKSPRVTMAIEPKIAEIIREMAKREKMELSQFLEQATIAWIRRWRPEFELEVEGPEGPQERTKILSVSENESDATSASVESSRKPTEKRRSRNTKRRTSSGRKSTSRRSPTKKRSA